MFLYSNYPMQFEVFQFFNHLFAMPKWRYAAIFLYYHTLGIDNERLAKRTFLTEHFLAPSVVGFDNRSIWIA
jgi:hypothetical protein